ncbi:hypothetical protein AVEN_136378-1 [Araneus ventricosus]|uniref:Uncharacterized protein n=1 Tax=Araneus ventricosus TaxID=182803 RepID=A0A4Y2AI11_ARAVE|nr:hypothetical protein AVEN_136378-1 [Araneus ventricosus]
MPNGPYKVKSGPEDGAWPSSGSISVDRKARKKGYLHLHLHAVTRLDSRESCSNPFGELLRRRFPFSSHQFRWVTVCQPQIHHLRALRSSKDAAPPPPLPIKTHPRPDFPD